MPESVALFRPGKGAHSPWSIPLTKTANEPARPAIVQGLVGSLMMTVGSYGVGWVNLGSPLARLPPIIMMRTEKWPVVASAALLAVGAMLLVRSWLRLGQRLSLWGPEAVKPVLAAITIWSVPLLMALPIYSRDVYAYNGQGRLLLEGFNPYETGVSTLNNWFQTGVDPRWASSLTPYGPVFLWLERAVASIAGDATEVAVFLFRLISVVGVLTMVYYLIRLAERHHTDPGRALWIALANPLAIVSFVASAHNDSLMVGFALAAFFYAGSFRGQRVGRGRWWLAAAALLCMAVSIGVKPTTVAALPFLGLAFVGGQTRVVQRLRIWAITGSVVAVLLLLMSMVDHLGGGWLLAGLRQPSGFIGYTPAAQLSMHVASLFTLLGGDFQANFTVLLQLCKWTGVALAVRLAFAKSRRPVVQSCGWAIAAIAMFNPIIQHWYVLWFIPFLAAAGMRNNWQLKTWYGIVIFFVIFGAQDQLNVWSFVETPIAPATIVGTITVIFLVYLLVVDPKIRRILLPDMQVALREQEQLTSTGR